MPPQNTDVARWFSEDIRPHETRLRAYLRGRFPDLRGETDDLIQETYARMVRAKEQGRSGLNCAFLFVVARNVGLDLFRHRKISQQVPLAELDRSGVVIDELDAADSAIHNQELALLADAINALPDRCREVFLLRRFDGSSYEEICAKLNLSKNTVSAHLVTAMCKIREYVRARGGAERKVMEHV